MKKKKDNQPADTVTPEVYTEALKADNEPAEFGENAIRAKCEDGGHTELPFKKTLYGFDALDVKNYIDELNANTLSVSRVYESKISELKDELALCYRERDSYKENVIKLREELEAAKSASPVEAPVPEEKPEAPVAAENDNAVSERNINRQIEAYEQQITELNTLIAKAENEIERLRVYEEETQKLKAENNGLSMEIANLRQKNNDLQLQLARFSEIAAAFDNTVAENEKLKAENASLTKAYDNVSNELNAGAESLAKMSSENEKLRIEISETGIKYTVMCRQAEKAESEAAELKEKNKMQAYDFAAKINEIDSQYAKEKLNLQKNLQVNAYHIKQMNMLVQELAGQVEQVEKSFGKTEVFH